MILYETYHVHILKPVVPEWTNNQEETSPEIVQDDVFCGLLELVATLYLRQRAKEYPLAAHLVAGVRHHYEHEMKMYERPFCGAALYDLLPVFRRLVEDLEGMAGTREIDAEAVSAAAKLETDGEPS